ncbi:MAG TPA: type II toxin-antitoxin system death-on-curing family toxin [Candidatus Rifleibacterium sp.]|nr:type II toxin-antitoxin system death-on-curing family toxin [Candidatus Rifleibacterium sp.]HPT48217.1 type II toxin-antitoxin system death-on-curing family toxin [Candidatus Rifleibacterium sp.]
MQKVRFLTLAEVLLILEDQTRRYGGRYGIRDLALLSSAVAMPETTFAGNYLHAGIPEMAAAYAYHICENHPFIDGNKRTALATALVFLDLNQYDCTCQHDELYEIMMSLARGECKKDRLTAFFKKHSHPRC